MHKNIYIVLLIIIGSIAYPVLGGEWRSAASLQTPRGGASAVVWDNYIYVFGGKSNDNNVLNTVERFDAVSNSWDSEFVPDFDHARYNASAVVFEDKIYLMGGRTEDEVFDEVEVYDPVQNQWEEAHKLRNDREGLAAAVFNDRIYAIGGQKDDYTLIDEIEWYNRAEDDWLEAIFDLPYPRAAHFAHAVEDTFYMFGGFFYGLTSTSYTAIPGSSGYEWIEGPELSKGRAYGATAFLNGDIYIIGGETSTGKTNAVEKYDILTKDFSEVSSLIEERSAMPAVTLNDTIYVIGGISEDGEDYLSSVEKYAPDATFIDRPSQFLVPDQHLLLNAYPNPFNGRIVISVQTNKAGNTHIDIFDLQGRKIKQVYSGLLGKGKSKFTWNALDTAGRYVSSGVYLVMVRSGNFLEKRKIVYVK